MVSADRPVLLLPARLETRFGDASVFGDGTVGSELWMRIYPDQIAIDTHEPALTEAEVSAGETYWQAIWGTPTGASNEELLPWRVLATRYGAPRAAWIARQLTPMNLDQRPGTPPFAGEHRWPGARYPL